jgi:hypothetical protein
MISDALPVLHVTIDGGPSITDWITAWATVATPVIALLAIWPVWRQLRILVTDKEREQAGRFAVWPEYSAKSKVTQILHANSSALPVYDVQGTVTVGDGKRPLTFELGTIGPTVEPVPDRTLSQLLQGEIETSLREKYGERVDRKNAYGDPDIPGDVLLGRSELVKNLRLTVSFRDTTGVAWRRMPDGRLAREKAKKATRL